MRLNKKGMWGPDFIIAMVIVILIGLGGVVFINFFVSGLSMQGLLDVIDSESDQKCYGILSAMVADEYVNSGENVTGVLHFGSLSNYYGGEQNGTLRSLRFESNMREFNNSIPITLDTVRISYMRYYLTSKQNAHLYSSPFLTTIQTNENAKDYLFCSIPIYGVYESGVAQLFMRIIGI